MTGTSRCNNSERKEKMSMGAKERGQDKAKQKTRAWREESKGRLTDVVDGIISGHMFSHTRIHLQNIIRREKRTVHVWIVTDE